MGRRSRSLRQVRVVPDGTNSPEPISVRNRNNNVNEVEPDFRPAPNVSRRWKFT